MQPPWSLQSQMGLYKYDTSTNGKALRTPEATIKSPNSRELHRELHRVWTSVGPERVIPAVGLRLIRILLQGQDLRAFPDPLGNEGYSTAQSRVTLTPMSFLAPWVQKLGAPSLLLLLILGAQTLRLPPTALPPGWAILRTTGSQSREGVGSWPWPPRQANILSILTSCTISGSKLDPSPCGRAFEALELQGAVLTQGTMADTTSMILPWSADHRAPFHTLL